MIVALHVSTTPPEIRGLIHSERRCSARRVLVGDLTPLSQSKRWIRLAARSRILSRHGRRRKRSRVISSACFKSSRKTACIRCATPRSLRRCPQCLASGMSRSGRTCGDDSLAGTTGSATRHGGRRTGSACGPEGILAATVEMRNTRVDLGIRQTGGRPAIVIRLRGAEALLSAGDVVDPFPRSGPRHGLALATARRLVENQQGTRRAERVAGALESVIELPPAAQPAEDVVMERQLTAVE